MSGSAGTGSLRGNENTIELMRRSLGTATNEVYPRNL
jgi:hypothetical protein